MEIKNYVFGEWISGEGNEIEHFHSITGEPISTASSNGIDYSAVFEYATCFHSNVSNDFNFSAVS